MNLDICKIEDNTLDIAVKVLDSQTGEILQDAHVFYTNNHRVGAITDSNGIAHFMDVPYGSEFTVSYIGYQNGSFIADIKYKEVALQLDAALDTVVITNDPKPKPIKKKGFGWWWLIALATVTLVANSEKTEKKKPLNVKL